MSTGIRDRRYLSGAAYIRTKQDLIFRDVFKVIPKTVVCKDLGIQPKSFNRFLERPDELKISEINKMAEMFEVDPQLILLAVFRQLRSATIKKRPHCLEAVSKNNTVVPSQS
jgi:hypothetical protein